MKNYYNNNSIVTDTTKIIQGVRGEEFKTFLINFMLNSGMKRSVIEQLCDEEGMELFNLAFTHKTADEENNYEYLEFLGDSVVNTSIVWYLNSRFPKLRGAKGVKIMARLKINLVSKNSFSEFAMKMDMWKFVSANEDVKMTKMKKTLEDVFEALFGCITTLMDTKIREGTGYAVVSKLIKYLFDEIEISTKYEDLFDAKTRLKELFDFHKKLGKCITKVERTDDDLFRIKIGYSENGQIKLIGEGWAPLKINAEQFASKSAIFCLNKMGIWKPIPDEYKNIE